MRRSGSRAILACAEGRERANPRDSETSDTALSPLWVREMGKKMLASPNIPDEYTF
jgi:hypothetical protein